MQKSSADRLAAVLDALESSGRRDGKEFRETLTELNNLRRKRAEQDRKAIHDHIAPVSGKITRAAEIKFDNDLHKRLRTPHVMQEGKDGLAFATRIIDTYDIQTDKPLPKFISKKTRAEYNSKTNTLDIGRLAGIGRLVPHEIGHYIEDGNPEIQKRCKEFFSKVTVGSEPRSLKQDYPRGQYDDNEMYKPANIKMPEYATKINPDGATEILAVGLQELQRNPVDFANKYPEFFDFVISTIKSTKK